MTTSQIDAVLASVDAGLEQSLTRLYALLRIKSISTDPAYAQECRKAADWIVDELKGLGFDAEARPTPGHPVVVAHGPEQQGAHVLFYAHYDVQPVDPLELWHTDPFEPQLKTDANGRKIIVARGASDDKGQMMTFIEACRAWKTATGALPTRISLMLEGEEESGGKNLPPFMQAHQDELAKADIALVCDTDMWDRQTPSITTMLRGLVADEVEITCANKDLHSGMFGNAARNPNQVLAEIIASLRAPDGSVTLPGFYDDVAEISPELKAQWAGLGFDEQAFLGRSGPFHPGRRTIALGARNALGAADLRNQRHDRGLYRGRLQDGDPGQGQRQDKLPPRLGHGPSQDPRRFPQACRGSHSPRLLGDIHPPWRLARHYRAQRRRPSAPGARRAVR
jgi:acetylornithine deacetylase/succinyl-diaminopimelate desuccinylase-like protein